VIPGRVVSDLCRLGYVGESQSTEARAILERLAPWHAIDRQGPDYWNQIADGLDTADLVALVRGLLLTEDLGGWGGTSSVAGVIWAYGALQRRDPASARLVAEWGCDKTNNSYVPFASRRADELKLRSAARQATRERIELEQADANRRHVERSRVVLEHAAATVRNAKERADHLAELADLPILDRLRALVRDRNRALSWFPKAWAGEAMDGVALLDATVRDELIERLVGVRTGPWCQLRRTLIVARENARDDKGHSGKRVSDPW